MQTPTRPGPHLTLALLTVLAIGAILWSLTTAPVNAEQQLRAAAGNTKGAASFVSTFTYALETTSGSQRSETVRYVYQAPDRVEEIGVNSSGQRVTLLVIGPERFVQQGNGRWVKLRAPLGASYGAEAANGLQVPIDQVSTATNVTRKGDVFRFTPGDEAKFLLTILGVQPAQLTPGSVEFVAQVQNEFVTTLEVTAATSTERVGAKLVYSQIDHAPALQAPPPSQVTVQG
ncbi:MAG TPA: hypothetical protein VE991_04765 [Acidimicrobiales bacterium]|nr:hypothetical protein [Acidimicrobiales bacterium]